MKVTTVVQSIALTSLVVAGMLTYSVVPAVKADNEDKITICHGAGQAGTTHFETLTISRNAVYQDQGEGGHFYENGTPKAGHEQDYLGACQTASANPSADPSVSPSVSPSASPSVSPSASPSVSPSVAPSVSPSVSPSNTPSNGSSNNSSNSNTSTTSSTTSNSGEVLGTYAQTGVVEDVIMNALGSLGGLMTVAGSVLYGNKKTKRNR